MLNEEKSAPASPAGRSGGEEEKDLPLPEIDLPLPEKELPANTNSSEVKTEKPKRNFPFLKILVFGFVGLVTIIAFGLIAYLMMGQNKTQENQIVETQVKTPTPDPTADWKTFTGKVMKVSFKVPEKWIIEEKEGFNDPDDSGASGKVNTRIYAEDPLSKQYFSVTENFFGGQAGFEEIPLLRQNISVDGKNGVKEYSKTLCDEDFWQCDKDQRKYFDMNIPYSWQIDLENINGNSYSLAAGWNESDYKSADEITDQILSTLKFTDQDSSVDTSNWKTHQGDRFSFKYPPDWNIRAITNNFEPSTLNIEFEFLEYTNYTSDEDFKNAEAKEEINVSGYKATKVMGSTGIGGSVFYLITYININNRTFMFEASTIGDGDSSNVKQIEREYDQILSTFNFTE